MVVELQVIYIKEGNMIKRSRHDRVLIYSARLALSIMCACLCLMDSDRRIFISALIVATLCAGYLAAYMYVNKDYKGGII